ncbi:MAG: DUF547 domain-containing protein [Candidatus Omnitrophica bacterium]|nr:DUF547 domain-containing protein [Candidatus Omnitrophota bacterium]
MKPGELALMGIGGMTVGFMLAVSPLINILFGWWLSPLLVLGGMLAILSGIFYALWETLKISMRFLVCLIFREEEQGKPAIRHFVLNTRIWQFLGGGHCPMFLHRMPLFLFLFLGTSTFFESAFASAEFTFDYSAYAKVLRGYAVNDRVDYLKLKRERQGLNEYMKSLESLSKENYEEMSRDEKIAFWINTYNAAAVKLVIDHYPLQKRFGWKALAYPENSIQQIPDVWARKVLKVFDESLSLNHIEHQILRKEFQEPRIHFALVCASLGCPVIRSEPYQGSKLDAQLNDQVRNFLSDPKKSRYDEATDTLYLSPIFKWFRKDFERADGILSFVKTHGPKEAKEKISEKTKIEWLEYDWSLNEKENKT